MNKIEYEIFLDKNEKPIIGMSDENIGKTENIFCILELAKFYIENSIMNIKPHMNEEELGIIGSVIAFLEDFTDEMGDVVLDMMKINGEIDMLNNNKYHIKVDTIEELKGINKPVIFESKIYNITPKLKALVLEDNLIYNYVNTINDVSTWLCESSNFEKQ